MENISEHRQFLNDVLIKMWRSMLPKNGLVYDIGKTLDFDYASEFSDFLYFTVDRDPRKLPSILADMETSGIKLEYGLADAILFNGVFEQCNNPFALWNNLVANLKPGGTILAGLAGIAMPPYGENDKWRVTEAGVAHFIYPLKSLHTFHLPEYHYVIAQL